MPLPAGETAGKDHTDRLQCAVITRHDTQQAKPLITDRQANFHLVFLVQLGQLAARLHMLPCHHLHGFQTPADRRQQFGLFLVTLRLTQAGTGSTQPAQGFVQLRFEPPQRRRAPGSPRHPRLGPGLGQVQTRRMDTVLT